MKKPMALLTLCLPQRTLTRLAGALAKRNLGGVTRWFIKRFINMYSVNMDEAQVSDYKQYATFNDFFTRQLRDGVRPIDADANIMVSPADGACGALGHIRSRQLLQAKGRYYSLLSLLANQQQLAEAFFSGHYLTVYLSPKDYHRVHMPIAGKLLSMTFVPGKLYSVAPAVMQQVDAVFAKNERVICVFETAIGKVAVVLVGAMIVGSMSLVWHGIVREKKREVKHWDYTDQDITFEKGAEIGQFQLGSTVIVLTQKAAVEDFLLSENDALLMGQSVASVVAKQN
jgi:phosphatidylserine decarboxylase